MRSAENGKETSPVGDSTSQDDYGGKDAVVVADPTKGRWERSWPTIACGAGLFSDGYLNGYAATACFPETFDWLIRYDSVRSVIGQVNTILSKIYGDSYDSSPAQSNVASIAFAGTVVGQLFFGYVSDHYSRKWALMASTVILIIFAALSAGSYGAGGSLHGMLAALTAWRFLLGIGIGRVVTRVEEGKINSLIVIVGLQWRVSSRQRRVRREHRRVEIRPSQPVVHHVHQRADRLWLRARELGAHDPRVDLHREPPPCCLENGTRSGRHSTAQSLLFAAEAPGAGRVQAGDDEGYEDALVASD